MSTNASQRRTSYARKKAVVDDDVEEREESRKEIVEDENDDQSDDGQDVVEDESENDVQSDDGQDDVEDDDEWVTPHQMPKKGRKKEARGGSQGQKTRYKRSVDLRQKRDDKSQNGSVTTNMTVSEIMQTAGLMGRRQAIGKLDWCQKSKEMQELFDEIVRTSEAAGIDLGLTWMEWHC